MKKQNEPLRVLIVDDEPLIRFTLSIFIMKKAEPRTVDSAENAFDEIEAHHYDLCFIDYNLPGMTGLEALKIIKERSEKTKVVIMSESYFDLDEDIKKQIDESAYAFIAKPFELSQIMELIKCAEGGQPELNEQVETIG
jgi:DNA-binding NtrC family response regulator